MARIDPLAGSAPVAPHAADEELETDRLPREHPRWVKDAPAVSQRARALLAALRPIALRVLSFWDHHMRAIRIGDRELTIDSSGSYRLE